MFLLKKSTTMPRETHIDMWGEAHYRALFGSANPAHTGQRGHRFSEQFSIRRTTLRPGYPLVDQLFAKARLPLAENTYCSYVVCLAFSEAGHDDDGYGYMSFGWQTLDRIYPSIDLMVFNRDEMADALMRMYFECKATGGSGLLCQWTANINSIIGKSSIDVWGDWFRDDWLEKPNDAEFLPGRRAFRLESIEFIGDQ